MPDDKRKVRTRSSQSQWQIYTKNVIFPPQTRIADFATFVWLAATELTQERVLYATVGGNKYLIAYGVNRSTHKSGDRITVFDDIYAIVVAKIEKFKKFIRFDPFDNKILAYENDFDNHATYKETVVFLRVEILPTETDLMVMEHLSVSEAE
jgi:hypothetical protein